MSELSVVPPDAPLSVAPFKTQLLKWVGNKQRFAHEIGSLLPADMGTYFEPFLGSGAVLATLAPERAIASDALEPLIEIFQELRSDPAGLVDWYADRMNGIKTHDDVVARYSEVKDSYNRHPNGADLLFLCRTCYGGVVRFRRADGFMSTPCGAHMPVSVKSFSSRASEWSRRVKGSRFVSSDFRQIMDSAQSGDVVYCDPPYTDTQAILYGSQAFRLADLVCEIELAKARGVRVALSIDGSKKSGLKEILFDFPDGLFETEVAITTGRSMLRRFQRGGDTLEDEVVKDRLLLTYAV
ncbi:Dam family site-specific DNA-(adenine-N6)-methyltransferase [Propionibacterium freudenreichii]|nr:Dam family site-specific DNA-(adenine-N6)-methyltransferase [Propionibacterium freudenreichii]